MRILHVGEYVSGGVATYIKDVIKYQEKHNDVGLVMSEKNSENIYMKGTKIYKYKKYRRGSLIHSFIFIFFIQKEIKKFKPDIVHIHSSFAGFLTRIIFLFKKKSFKLVYCSHGWSFSQDINNFKKRVFGIIEKFLSLFTDAIINISVSEYQNALKYSLPEPKMFLIQNGVRPPIYSSKNVVKINQSKLNILFIGRFDFAKGIDILINLFKQNRFDNIDLTLIGSSILNEFKDELFLNLPSNIRQLSWVSNEQIDDFIINFDAVIVPSRWEGFGLVVIESLRNKVPVICNNIRPLNQLVINGYNGIVYMDEENLIDVLKNVSKGYLKQLGENGFKIYQETYTSKKMNEEIMRLYEKLLK